MQARGATVAAPARFDARTKRLLHRLRPGEIAIVRHRDLDQVAAEGLVLAGARAVINLEPFLSGRFPAGGARLLLEHGVTMYEVVGGHQALEAWPDGRLLALDCATGAVYAGGAIVARLRPIGEAWVRAELERASRRLDEELQRFLDNTLDWARRERELLLGRVPIPPLRVSLRGRPALVVARGHHYRRDLRAVRAFIRDQRPALIGVDGGADALLEAGFRPDVIVGDMDSVSDRVLRCGAELVVHAYPDGSAPGLERVRALGLQAHRFPVGGTSEDAALLLAHDGGADPIVAVGTHTNLIDFLEKGRPGMASTLLVRLKVGPRLVDAKGVGCLYRSTAASPHLGPVVAAAAATAAAVVAVSPPVHGVLRVLWLGLRVALGL